MFEEAIAQLDSMGIPYTENEDGSLLIDISGADKTDVVTIISFLNDNALEFSITADEITVHGMPEPVEALTDGEDESLDLGDGEDPLAGLLG